MFAIKHNECQIFLNSARDSEPDQFTLTRSIRPNISWKNVKLQFKQILIYFTPVYYVDVKLVLNMNESLLIIFTLQYFGVIKLPQNCFSDEKYIEYSLLGVAIFDVIHNNKHAVFL